MASSGLTLLIGWRMLAFCIMPTTPGETTLSLLTERITQTGLTEGLILTSYCLSNPNFPRCIHWKYTVFSVIFGNNIDRATEKKLYCRFLVLFLNFSSLWNNVQTGTLNEDCNVIQMKQKIRKNRIENAKCNQIAMIMLYQSSLKFKTSSEAT